MILYSLSAQQSAVALFTAGPAESAHRLSMPPTSWLCASRRSGSRRARAGTPSGARPGGSWSISTVVVIFGGIYGGVFTPAEAAGVAIYSLFVTMVVHRGWLGRSLAHHHELSIPDRKSMIVTAADSTPGCSTSGIATNQQSRPAVAGMGIAPVHQRRAPGDGEFPGAAAHLI
jgi:TRAP-type C4-dicarboxylate transport system permease large subunit